MLVQIGVYYNNIQNNMQCSVWKNIEFLNVIAGCTVHAVTIGLCWVVRK